LRSAKNEASYDGVKAHASKRDVGHPRAKTLSFARIGHPGVNSSGGLRLPPVPYRCVGWPTESTAPVLLREPPRSDLRKLAPRYCDLGELCAQPSPIVRADLWRRHFNWPSIAHAMLKLELTSIDPRRIALLSNLYAGVTEKNRNSISEKHLHRECVPEHMRVATLRGSVWPLEVSDDEESSGTSLPRPGRSIRGSIG
jgi:hypothetical protein